MELDNLKPSANFQEQLAERERVRKRIQELIANGEISLTRLYESSPESTSEDPGF